MIVAIYILVGLINIISDSLKITSINYTTKVMLMPLLICILYNETKKIKSFSLIYAALFFSWLGDIFLMFPRNEYSEKVRLMLFVFGLSSFLIAHINYIFHFIKEINTSKTEKSFIEQKPIYLLPFLVYLMVFFYFLFPFLGGLKIPVFVYGICIILMLAMALNRKNKVAENSFLLVFIGAILFVVSDTVLAIHLFYQKMDWYRIVIMSTYIFGQLFIVKEIAKTNA